MEDARAYAAAFEVINHDQLIVRGTPTRAAVIGWLCWNDKDGCYTDGDALAEFGQAWTATELLASVLRNHGMDIVADEVDDM